jgi:hypothetical protein
MNLRTDHIGVDDECVKIYDPSKKELIKVFDNYGDAGKYLGLSPKVLRNAAIGKTRRFSPILNKEVAIRVGLKK